MESGRLRHRIIIQAPTRAGDAMGQAIETWATYATVWADVQPLKGREFFEAQKVSSEVSAKIITRYVSGVTPKCRIVHGTSTYRIVGEIINPGMKNITLHFMVTQQPQAAT